MAFHVFIREGVDAAVFEVGVGGELDSTNIIPQPAVTGITTLGINHVATLSDTIDKIARNKAGIFKTGSPAFTVLQVPDAMEVLQQRAKEMGINLVTIAVHPALFDIGLKPAEDFQRTNASLAIRLSLTLLDKLGVRVELGPLTLPEQFTQGRCETLTLGKQTWHLDSAHTDESLKLAAWWFGRVSKSQPVSSRYGSFSPLPHPSRFRLTLIGLGIHQGCSYSISSLQEMLRRFFELRTVRYTTITT